MSAIDVTATDWFQIIGGEFQEVPGLCLTKGEIQRLWDLDAPTCDEVLDALVRTRFLRRTDEGTYARVDSDNEAIPVVA